MIEYVGLKVGPDSQGLENFNLVQGEYFQSHPSHLSSTSL